MHHRGAGEVHRAMTQGEVLAERGQPAAAPDPVGVKRIDEHGDEEGVGNEGLEGPAFGHGAGGDGGGGVHEDHLEQEQREDHRVVGHAGQEEARRAENPELVAADVDGHLVGEHLRPAEAGHAADAAHLEGEAADPVTEHADAVDHEVHGHGVACVFGAGESGLGQGEAGLHEHDQEAADQRPDHVDGDAVVADHVGQLGGQGFLFGQGRHVFLGGRAGRRADDVGRGADGSAGRIGNRGVIGQRRKRQGQREG